MATTAEVVAALTGVLAEIPGLMVYDHVPDSVQVTGPVAVVIPRAAARVSVNSGMFNRQFEIVVAVQRSTDRPGQQKLFEFMDASGARSVHAQLHANQGLGLTGVSMAWNGDTGLDTVRDVPGVDWCGFATAPTVTYTTGV